MQRRADPLHPAIAKRVVQTVQGMMGLAARCPRSAAASGALVLLGHGHLHRGITPHQGAALIASAPGTL
jgi:hypothetical protein